MPPYDRAWEPGLLVSDEMWEPGLLVSDGTWELDLLEIIDNLGRISTDVVDTPARGWYHHLATQPTR